MKNYFAIIAVSVVLAFLFLRLVSNYSGTFDEVDNSYLEESAVNLAKGVKAQDIGSVLSLHGYVAKEDAKFISDFLTQRLDEGYRLKALYDLNDYEWQVPACMIDSVGSAGFRDRLISSQKIIGIDSMFVLMSAESLKDCVIMEDKYEGKGRITVSVKSKNNSTGLLKRMPRQAGIPAEGIIVRLSRHYVDTSSLEPLSEILCYLKTDKNGKVVFDGLNPEFSYSVIPVREGYEYGSSKGTVGGCLSEVAENGILECSFQERKHTVKLFDTATLMQIKEDHTITVRTPEEFKGELVLYLVLFFVAWWGLFLLACSGKSTCDKGVIAVLMLLTGMCLLTMFSLNDPLTDKLLGVDMAQGILAGVVVMMLLLKVDFIKFYQNRMKIGFDLPLECVKWVFKPFRRKVKYLTDIMSDKRGNFITKLLALICVLVCLPMLLLDLVRLTRLSDRVSSALDKMPKGAGYLFSALLLTVLLFTPLGVSVGGMKVNLRIGIVFQPSEIAKYLIVVFMAAYFCVNTDTIVKFSEKGNTGLLGSKLRMLSFMILGLGTIVILYLVLGDMGPAIVLAFTFIFLYSIVKSKVNLDGITDKLQMKLILTCDLAMLVYGVISFIVCLWIGYLIGHMGIFCVGWFFFWILIGIVRKQVFESAVLFNAIVAVFIFGGQLLNKIPSLKDIGERLDSRNEMCTNVWGVLPVDGIVADAGENTQVAEGLWGLASGGLWGQGLGNGSPHFIPAFHTDMVLESIGEQMGMLGLMLIIVLFAILLRRTILLGYRTTHTFAFYLCLGIAIVTAVQFMVISLGSTGVIPLTGVTVPFLSYGKVSMILNLTAFGIILSINRHNVSDVAGKNSRLANLRKRNIGKYNYSVSILCWVYMLFAFLICGVFFFYQVMDRNRTLVRPVYVNNSDGVPVVEYNPRIEQLTRKMYAGSIYDRKGILLATSDRTALSEFLDVYSDLGVDKWNAKAMQLRYYPFGEHLFFMLGDINTKLFFGSLENSPRGYMAEARYLSELRGYDNKMKTKDGKPLRITLFSDKYRPGRYLSPDYEFSVKGFQLRDYSALIPYLKAGNNSRKVERLNKGKSRFWEIEPQDLHLTIDAVLQTRLQQDMEKYVKNNLYTSAWNRLRVSVVVLDAENGDLLASANYPLPDYDLLARDDSDYYVDYMNYRDSDWKAYTDMDLGLFNATAPGSSAKVMSALAGMRKLGVSAKDSTYYVYPSQRIADYEPFGLITMEDAIVKSSNCYFINLVNDCDLYEDLAYVYATVGAKVGLEKSYGLYYDDYDAESDWTSIVTDKSPEAVSEYESYVEQDLKDRMNNGIWQWAWGQGDLATTPLDMARVASIVENGGDMPVTRYLSDEDCVNVPVVTKDEASVLKQYMIKEAGKHKFPYSGIGGKTGTADRVIDPVTGVKMYDGWYICFIENGNDGKHPISLAVRMERGRSSDNAVKLTRDVVLRVLRELGYIN